jgi:Tol biopolymer transport system component
LFLPFASVILAFLVAGCLPVRVSVTYDITPEWSPNGQTIVFVCYTPTSQDVVENRRDGELLYPPQSSEICTMASDGSQRTRLTQNRASDFDPKWSPDGTQIAFVSNRAGNYDLYLMNADGSAQQKISNNGFVDRPAWSPNGQQIAYGSGEGIYLLDVKAGQERRLVKGAFDSPVWSPDGRAIAFIAHIQGKQNCTVRIAWADSGTEMVPAQVAQCRMPIWSPDNTRLMYVSPTSDSGQRALSLLDIRSTASSVLINESRAISDIAWSSSDERIYYSVENGDLFAVRVEGSGSSYITNLGTLVTLYKKHSMAVNPSGQIAFLRGENTDVISGPIRVWRINSDGSDLIQLSP